MKHISGKMAHAPILLCIFLTIMPSMSYVGFSASNYQDLRDCIHRCLILRIKQRNECAKRCVCCLPGSEEFIRCKNFHSATNQFYDDPKINSENSIDDTYKTCAMTSIQNLH